MKKPLLTLCMMVKNEAENLARCLQTVQGIVDQIVVVDTGSTDGSKSIAGRFTDQVFDFTWNNDFSAVRNYALRHAAGEWILQLDADERIEPDAWVSVRSLLSGTKADGLLVKIRNFHPSGDSVQFLDSEQLRLFRNRPAYRYENRIHEQVTPSLLRRKGRLQKTDLRILHYGYQKNSKQKAERNLQLIEEELSSGNDHAYLLFKKGESCKALGRFEEAERCFLKVLEKPQESLEGELWATLYLRLAQINLQRNNFRNAIQFSEQTLFLQPKNLTAHYVRSVAGLYLQQLDVVQQSLLAIEKWDHSHILKEDDVHRLKAILTQLKEKRETVGV